MSEFAPRILELLRRIKYNGSDRFTVRDIEIMAGDKSVAAIFAKFAALDDRQFITKDQLRNLQLAHELNNPSLVPLEPEEVRKKVAELRHFQREKTRRALEERHRNDEKAQLREMIRILKEDKVMRDEVRKQKEIETQLYEVQVKKAEEHLKLAQQQSHKATSNLAIEWQAKLKSMSQFMDNLRTTDGIRNNLDSEKYVETANAIVDSVETLNRIVLEPEVDPRKYAFRIGNKYLPVIATLERASESLDSLHEEIEQTIRSQRRSIAVSSQLIEESSKFKKILQGAIDKFITDLFENAKFFTEKRLEELVPLARNLEGVIFAQRCGLLRELELLKETQKMVQETHNWARTLAIDKNGLDQTLNSTMQSCRSQFSKNSTVLTEMSFQPSPCLSSTFDMTATSLPDKHYAATSHSSTMSILSTGKTLSHFAQIDDYISSIARDCSHFERCFDQILSESAILGANGIQFIAEGDSIQLRSLSERTAQRKRLLKRLMGVQQTLERDIRDQTNAHYQRTLVPLYVLDRSQYEELLSHVRPHL